MVRGISMLSSYIYSNPLNETLKAFVCGEMSMLDFISLYNKSDEIAHYLNHIVDYIEKNNVTIKKRTIFMKNVNQNKPFEARSYIEKFIKEYAQSFVNLSLSWKENPPLVGEYLKKLSPLTAYGANLIHSIVADIYYQIDSSLEKTEKYHQEYEFSIDVLPRYLCGGVSAESYVSQYIMPKYPATMKKGERKRLVKEEIKQSFLRDCKGYPRWLQSPEWPMGSDGKPMVYTGQKSFDDYSEYYFRDVITNSKETVTQWW